MKCFILQVVLKNVQSNYPSYNFFSICFIILVQHCCHNDNFLLFGKKLNQVIKSPSKRLVWWLGESKKADLNTKNK